MSTVIANTGLLGAAALTASTWGYPYTAPASTFAAITISVCNTATTGTAHVTLAVTAQAGAPLAGEYFTSVLAVPAGQTLEFTKTVGPGQKVAALSDTSNVNAVVNGVETNLF